MNVHIEPTPSIIGEVVCECGERISVEGVLIARVDPVTFDVVLGSRIRSAELEFHSMEHGVFPEATS